MNLSILKSVLLASVLFILSACTVAPVLPPVLGTAPEQFKEARPAVLPASAVPDAWWTLFNDPVLNVLEQRVVLGNESLKASLAQIASVRATLQASYSAKLPTLFTGLATSRAGNSASSNNTLENPSNNMTLNATAAWELDVWGKLSRASLADQASLQASESDLAAVKLSVQSTLAQTYFSMRLAEAQKTFLEKTVQAYQKSLEITHARRQSGVASLSDELQATTQLNTTKVQLADVTAQRAQFEHAMAVLLGVPPASLVMPSTSLLPEAIEIPLLLPSTLLQRRPDIAAARQRVEAAYQQIGVTDAAMFPAVGLSANVGYNQNSLANLLSAPHILWTLGASLTQSILDGGVKAKASAQARASADLATSSYRQLVLTSLQEVEDNLVLSAQLKNQVQWQQLALQSAQRNLEITVAQYSAGTVSYLNVVSAQATSLSAESTLLTVKFRQLAALNSLLKNMAGRWD